MKKRVTLKVPKQAADRLRQQAKNEGMYLADMVLKNVAEYEAKQDEWKESYKAHLSKTITLSRKIEG